MNNDTIVQRALLSASDKTGLAQRARQLQQMGVELIATGGTKRFLDEAGIKSRDVSEFTGFPEIMEGRLKTLHPTVHGGLLFRRDKDADSAARHGIEPIDLAFIELYPFENCAASGAEFDTCIENIDIGGPTMLRAAAKNAAAVTACADLQDLDDAIAQMRRNDGKTGLALRRRLAGKAFARTAAYDAAIAQWYAAQNNDEHPLRRIFAGRRREILRYGENPHQSAAVYAMHGGGGVLNARQVRGKNLSYNNINDLDAALALIVEFDADRPAAAIVKHAGPCGVARADTMAKAYQAACAGDPVSAFGGVAALNRTLDAATAKAIAGIFTEAVIAPGADAAATDMLRPNTRLLLLDEMPEPDANALDIRSIAGGLLVQRRDCGNIVEQDLQCVTKTRPDKTQMRDLMFAWRVAKHVRSNAIVYARDEAVCGIGAGQASRIDAARIGGAKAADGSYAGAKAAAGNDVGAKAAAGNDAGAKAAKPCVAASDAFFPFTDGLEAAVVAGATAIIQPGGSRRDEELIAAANRFGIAMVFTGMRHFRH